MIEDSLYQAWLRDPVTRAVFAQAELIARPQSLTDLSSESESSYRLGYVTGSWDMLDRIRAFNFTPTEEPTMSYEGNE